SKPNLLRSGKNMAEKACHVFTSTTQVGLTQALAPMLKFRENWDEELKRDRQMRAEQQAKERLLRRRMLLLKIVCSCLAIASLAWPVWVGISGGALSWKRSGPYTWDQSPLQFAITGAAHSLAGLSVSALLFAFVGIGFLEKRYDINGR
ncbi:hypothetical protein ACFOLC_16140, partial [Lysobacter cavernae]